VTVILVTTPNIWVW